MVDLTKCLRPGCGHVRFEHDIGAKCKKCQCAEFQYAPTKEGQSKLHDDLVNRRGVLEAQKHVAGLAEAVEEVGDRVLDLDEGEDAEEPESPRFDTDTEESLEALMSPDAPLTCYMGGPAGCGKSFLVRAWEERDRRVQLVSTTGIAALNLGGTTINSALGYFDTASMRDAYVDGWLQARLRKNRSSGFTRWVVDEVSMMDAEQLDILMKAVDEVNEDDKRPDKQVGVVLVGDFAQLPPVKGEFVFSAKCWPRFQKNGMILTQIRRQADEAFITALRHARRGEGEKALEFFRPLLHERKDDEFQGTTILAKNDEVDRYNELRHEALPGRLHSFETKREGKPRGEWAKIPDQVELKEGALVMVLANRYDPEYEEYVYVNGDLGTFLGPFPDSEATRSGAVQAWGARVRLQRDGGGEVTVRRVTRENSKATGATGAKKDRVKVEGTVTYMPLRLAYASTVHKSQGLSLDTVQISYSNHFFSNPGSMYVALSRARTAEGLRLVGNPDTFIARCRADERVTRWL